MSKSTIGLVLDGKWLKKAALLALILLVGVGVLPSSKGQYDTPNVVHYSCFDNTTLRVEYNESRCISGTCFPLAKDTLVFCEFGCDSVTQSCSPNNFTVTVEIIGAVIVVFVIALYLANRRRRF